MKTYGVDEHCAGRERGGLQLVTHGAAPEKSERDGSGRGKAPVRDPGGTLAAAGKAHEAEHALQLAEIDLAVGQEGRRHRRPVEEGEPGVAAEGEP